MKVSGPGRKVEFHLLASNGEKKSGEAEVQ